MKMKNLGNYKYGKLLSYIVTGSGLIILIVMISVVLSFRAKKEIEEYTIKNEEVFLYFGNQKIEYDSKITLNRNNNITKILVNGEEIDVDSEPIYYKKNKKLILSSNMLIVFPLNGMLQKRLNYYTTITMNGKHFIVSNKGLNKDISSSVLYDGNDLYLFMEETNIEFGDHKIKISPFSFVLCNYKGDLYIYNYEKDFVESYEDVKEIVYAKNKSYEINLSVDSIKFNEKSILLTKNIDLLEVLK